MRMRLHLGTKNLERTVESLKTRYVNIFKQYVPRKETKLQMLEINGKQLFGQGLYHNPAYEDLIKAQIPLRSAFVNEKDNTARKQIANEQHHLWMNYINLRFEELPEEMELTEGMTKNIFQVIEGNKDREKQVVTSENLPRVFHEYASLFEFKPVIDPYFIEQMAHPYKGYLLNYQGGYTYEDIIQVYRILMVATFEKLLGQDLLGLEVSSFAYWNNLNRGQNVGHLEFAQFLELLNYVRFDIQSFDEFENEFKYLLSYNDGEFIPESKEKIVRSDFFRQIFLERYL